jgi:membrane protein
LLLLSFVVGGSLHALHDYLQANIPGGHYLGLTVFYIFDSGIITLLFAALFYYLPDARMSWRDVLMGAVLTAVLFVISKFLLGLYLGSGAAGSAYGAASSLVTLLLWIFYSAQIFLFGAEFTKVYAETYGSQVRPHHYAVKVERKEIELPSQEISESSKEAISPRTSKALRQLILGPLHHALGDYSCQFPDVGDGSDPS